MPARHVQNDFHQDINDLVKQGVSEKVEHSTECHSQEICFHEQWKFPCSTSSNQVEAMNLFRPKRSEEALECEPFYSRSVDELIVKFHRCTVFSIVDMKKGYCMVILHPNSRSLML